MVLNASKRVIGIRGFLQVGNLRIKADSSIPSFVFPVATNEGLSTINAVIGYYYSLSLTNSKTMANIGTILKSEIARIARKEVRGEMQQLKKQSAQYRSDIAALKKRAAAMEQQLKRQLRSEKRAAAPQAQELPQGVRFSAKGLAARRQKLGLSAREFGALIGVSGQSVYHWEQGKTRPRASQLQAIAALRRLGKREAAARLSGLGA